MKDYDGKSNYLYGTRGVIYVKSLLMNLNQEKLLEACSISDEARGLGYQVTRNTAFLDKANDKVALDALTID